MQSIFRTFSVEAGRDKIQLTPTLDWLNSGCIQKIHTTIHAHFL